MTLTRTSPGRLLAAGAALLLVAGCTPGDRSPGHEPLPARSNILLITVDTLRADHLSSYGYPRPTSPTLDRLAAEGVRFDQATVQWPKTGPSMASMFTATYPKDNDIVRQVGIPLPCRFRMLAEVLQRQGYATHAVVANGALASEFFFDQGFDTYLETWKLAPRDPAEDPNGAAAVTALALALLDRLDPGKPFFLWVHYLDPHFPYSPPGEWRQRFQGDPWFDPAPRVHVFADKQTNQMYGIGGGQVLDGRDELAFYVARYDAEIAYTDGEIDRLLAAMAERGLLERTLTVATSDHGESLGEHVYYFDHGRFTFQTCLRVPLIVHYPGVLAPRVVAEPVELIHLAPTLLEAAGVALDDGAWMQGRSLTPWLRGQAPADGPVPVFAEGGYETGNRWQKTVRADRFKLIFAESQTDQRWIGGVGQRFVLYDLAADPGETENVADRHPDELERLKLALWQWEKAEKFPLLFDPPGCGEERTMDEETEKLLKALGYL